MSDQAPPWNQAWTSLLDFLSRIVTPNWSEVIDWLPLLFSGLVVLILLLVALGWLRAMAPNRSRVPRPVGDAPPPGVHLPGPSRWPFVVPVGAALILFGLAIRPTNASGQPSSPVNWPMLTVGLVVTAVALVGWLRDAMREWRRAEGIPDTTALVAAHAGPAALAPSLPAGVLPARNVPAAVSVPVQAVRAAEREPPPSVHLPGPSPWPFLAPIALAVIFFGLVFGPAIILGGIVMGLIAAAGWLRDAGSEYRQVNAGHPAEPRTRDPEKALPSRLLAAYVAIAALSLALLVAPRIIAFANSSGQPAGAGGGTTGSPRPPGSAITISAQQNKFSTAELRIPAGKPFSLTFDNKDSVPHNVAIYTDSSLGQALFQGEIFAGPKSVTYNVPAIAAGEHYFVCNVHPNMKGTAVAQ